MLVYNCTQKYYSIIWANFTAIQRLSFEGFFNIMVNIPLKSFPIPNPFFFFIFTPYYSPLPSSVRKRIAPQKMYDISIAPTPIVLNTIEAHVRRHFPPPFFLSLLSLMFLTTTVPKWHTQHSTIIIHFCYAFIYKNINIDHLTLPFSFPLRSGGCLLEDVDVLSIITSFICNYRTDPISK